MVKKVKTPKHASAKKEARNKGPKPATSSVSVESRTKRKQLGRRNSDEQADRYISRKLSHVDAARLKTLRSDEGLSVHQFVKAELRKKRCTQGRLSSAFVVKLFKAFHLQASVYDDLPSPPDTGVNKELYDLASLCHDENKFVRDVKPLCSFLDSCDELDEANFHSLLVASLPGPLLDTTNAQKIQIAILGYVVRFSVHEKLPRYWEVIAPQLDSALKKCFETVVSEGVRMKNFLKNRADTIKLFVPPEVVDKLIAADGDYANCANEVRIMMTSGFETGAAMFKDKWLSCANEIYQGEIRDQLSALEHNEFAEGEIDAFQRILAGRAAALKKLGEGKKLKWMYSFDLFGAALPAMEVDNPRDAATHAMKNRMKTIGVNSGQLKPLWWEKLLVPPGSVSCCPETARLPEKWVAKLLPAREFCEDIVEGCTTIAQCVNKIDKAAATLIGLDRNFECDVLFVRHCATKLLQEKANALILGTLPTCGEEADFAQTLEKLRGAKQSEVVVALGEAFGIEVDGIYDTIQQISSGQPPQDRDLGRLSSLTKEVLQRAAWFCKCEVPLDVRKARGMKNSSYLYGVWRFQDDARADGVEAVQFRFKMLEDRRSGDDAFGLQDLRPVKQFRWLLEDAQKLTFAKWLKLAIPAHNNFAPALTAGPSKEEQEGAIGPASSSAAASSSSAAAPAAPKKKAKTGTDKASNDAKKAMMAKMFRLK